GGCWLRSDSVILDEPVQIDALANRPPWLAAVMEDGYYRSYRTGVPIDNSMLHCLDLGANYWSLWTEAANVARYQQEHPEAFALLRQRLGYRVRPSWVWQRKREGDELVVAIANDGVAGVPGALRVSAHTQDGARVAGGSLDAGQPHGGGVRLASLRLPAGLPG